MRNNILFWLVLTLTITSCKTNQEILGKYRSNFASLGFFITVIDLKPDSAFHYTFSGDLMHTELDGKYIIDNNRLYLRFDKLKEDFNENLIEINEENDTIVNWTDWQNSHSYELKYENGIEYHLKYRIKKNILQVYHIETGRIVRRDRYYSDRKRFILFGPQYYMKKCYLKKIN